MLQRLASQRRQEFLGDLSRLAKIVDQMGGPAAPREVEAALDDVRR